MQSILSLFLSCVFTTHLVLAVAWWWFMPGGFPLSHPRFWVNRVVPMMMIAGVIAYLWARRSKRTDLICALSLGLAAFWAAASVSGRIVFPVTARVIWLLPLLGATFLALVATRHAQISRKLALRVLIPAIVVGAALGALVPITQRGEDPDTRPLNIAFDAIEPSETDLSSKTVRLSDSLRVEPAGGVVYIDCGRLHLDIEPVLTFISRSPDRCWTLLARRRDRVGPPRRVLALYESPGAAQIDYADDGRSRLLVTERGTGRRLVEASSKLDREIYSHLNSYCSIMVMGHRKLEVSFSPCPDSRIEVTEFDYPFGRPARFAYMAADGSFKVVEASSAERGPFRTLASGRIERGEPLGITLFDQGESVARIVLEDWSAQAATALSPTAGWGLPLNSIAFSLTDSSATSPAFISIELAGTGIGRGYDSVGHAAGVYRNRMTVEDNSAR